MLTLDGIWEIAEGTADAVPHDFLATVPVPGLADMATPAFEAVGFNDERREAFWYRRRFTLAEQVPARATLKIGKARYGKRVILNGATVGEHGPNFTPGHFQVGHLLRGSGAENELLVRVGAWRDSTPPGCADGFDLEKQRYIPGIYDSVSVMLSGTPHIVSLQTVPDLERGSVVVAVVVRNDRLDRAEAALDCLVREAVSGDAVGRARTEAVVLTPSEERELRVEVPIERPTLWSPENPFLYRLEAATAHDSLSVRFGMRTFTFDREEGRAILNGKPYALRGTNVCTYRFFEDGEREDKPWREDWVRRLHERFKEMEWNAIRYCLGFPPELWYDVADELGFLIMDEYPIWYPFVTGMSKAIDDLADEGVDLEPFDLEDPTAGVWPDHLTAESLAAEFAEWIRERCNHPSVVTWDAQNETLSDETGKVIGAVRSLDLQERPWDNGYGPCQAECDTYEVHWYPFAPFLNRRDEPLSLARLKSMAKTPQGVSMLGASLEEAIGQFRAAANGETLIENASVNVNGNAIVVNEYGYLWLNRDGTPTSLTRRVYARLKGWPVESSGDRFYTHARLLAAETEFLRCNRAVAGVLHFCGLGYSRPDGATSDNFVDVDSLEFEPNFWRFVRDAFHPIGLMVDIWDDQFIGGRVLEVPVVVVNDLDTQFDGPVTLRLVDGRESVLFERRRKAHVGPLGQDRIVFVVPLPAEPGAYRLNAELDTGARSVHSLRDFVVVSDAQSGDDQLQLPSAIEHRPTSHDAAKS